MSQTSIFDKIHIRHYTLVLITEFGAREDTKRPKCNMTCYIKTSV